MVDAADTAAGQGQHVPALAVGVVGHHVEQGHPPQIRVVPVGQRHRFPAEARGVDDPQPAGRQRARRHDVDQADLLVAFHPQLGHARPERSLAQHGGGHDRPTRGLGQQIGRDLAAGQGAVGEVPQWPLPRDGLVHACSGHAVQRDLTEERRVGGLDDAPGDGDLAVREQPQGVRDLKDRHELKC